MIHGNVGIKEAVLGDFFDFFLWIYCAEYSYRYPTEYRMWKDIRPADYPMYPVLLDDKLSTRYKASTTCACAQVPHFASLRGKEREIVILRSDNGEKWVEHSLEATEEAVQEVLQESFDGDGKSAQLVSWI